MDTKKENLFTEPKISDKLCLSIGKNPHKRQVSLTKSCSISSQSWHHPVHTNIQELHAESSLMNLSNLRVKVIWDEKEVGDLQNS